jgi:hypothetical protein
VSLRPSRAEHCPSGGVSAGAWGQRVLSLSVAVLTSFLYRSVLCYSWLVGLGVRADGGSNVPCSGSCIGRSNHQFAWVAAAATVPHDVTCGSSPAANLPLLASSALGKRGGSGTLGARRVK